MPGARERPRRRADRSRYTYADVSIVCGTPVVVPQRSGSATLANPRVLIKVLSPSIESIGRGEQFRRFRRIKSLQEYLLV